MSSETDDCLVKEVDVFLAKSLSSNIHILQVKNILHFY